MPNHPSDARSSRFAPRRLVRDWRFWIVAVVALYTVVGFLVVPPVAKRQVVSGVRKTLGCEASIAGIRFNPYTFNASVRGFALADRRGAPVAGFERLFVNFAPWPLHKRVVALEEVRVSGPTLAVRIRGDRSVNLLDLAPPAPADSAPAGKPSQPWVVRVDRLEVSAMSLAYEDSTVTPPARAAIDSLDARVTGFAAVPGDSARFEVRLLSRDGGRIAASGFARPLEGEVEARVDVDSLVVTPAAPYLARFAYLDLKRGKLNVHGDVRAAAPKGAPPAASFAGDIVIDDFDLFDTLKQQDFFGFKRVAVLDAKAQSNPPGARVEEVSLSGIFARIAIAQDGSFNVNDVMAPARAYADSTRAARPEAPDTSAAAPPPDVTIGRIRIDGGEIDFSDLSLPLPFAARVHDVSGEVTAIARDNAAGSQLLIEGAVDEHGFAKASGFINPFDPVAFTDIDVSFRNIEMTSMTPYSGKFAGYQIKRGKLSLALSYDIQRAQLKADHKILLEKLTLGEKIESPDAVGLPVKLAVALLKDKNGNIDLDLEVAGDLNDPKVNTASLIWQALKKVIVKVTTAPFRFLGNLVGIGGDEMEFVEFEAGRTNLTGPQHERLGNLAKALGERPALKLQVRGAFDKESDAQAIRAQRFEALLSQRLLAAAGGDTTVVRTIEADPSSGRMQAVLEAMVTETFGAQKLAELRAAHAAAPATVPAAAALDLAGYFKAMRDELIARQPVSAPELEALATSRSAAIRAYLVERDSLPVERVEIVEREEHGDGAAWVRCQLSLEGTD